MGSSIFLSGVLLLIAASASSGQDSLPPKLNFLDDFLCDTAPHGMKNLNSNQFFNGKWFVQGALASKHITEFSFARCNTFDSKTDGRKVQALMYSYINFPIFRYRSHSYTFSTPEETGKDEIVLVTGIKAIWEFSKWFILETDYSNYAVVYSCSSVRGKVLIALSRERKDTSNKQKLIELSEKVGISDGKYYTDKALTKGCPSKEPSIN